jgi:hypothetical protein
VDWLSLSGNLASIVGLLISLVTLFIAQRAKAAAEQARDEVQRIWKISEVARIHRPQVQQWAEKATYWLQAIKIGESDRQTSIRSAIEIHASISRNRALLIEVSSPKVAKAVDQALASLRKFIDTSGDDLAGARLAYELIQKIASELDVEFFR